MAVELGGVQVHGVTDVSVRERTRLARHPVPGRDGDVVQVLGRPSVVVAFAGSCYGPDAAGQVRRLRDAHSSGRPLDFFAEAVGEGFATQVVIEELDVRQQARRVDELGFRCTVVEYVEPPAQRSEDPFGAIDAALGIEAAGFLDDVQGALGQVTALTGALAGSVDFGDPTARLGRAVDAFVAAVGTGPALLDSVRGDVPPGVPGLRELVDGTGRATELARVVAGGARGLPGTATAPVAEALAELSRRVDVDVTGLTARLPDALATVDGVLRPASLEYVEGIGAAYRTADRALAGHRVLAAAGGGTVPEAVLAALDTVADGFAARVAGGVVRVVDPASVAAVTEALANLDRLRDDPAGGGLLPVFAEHLIGLPATLLDPAHAAVDAALSIAEVAEGVPGDARLADPLSALAGAYRSVVSALDAFDPAAESSYRAVRTALDAVEAAAGQVGGGLGEAYAAVATGLDGHDWAGMLGYGELLDRAAGRAAGVSTLDDIGYRVAELLEGVATGLSRILDPAELTRRGRILTDGLRAAVDASPLSQVRQILAEFVGELGELVGSVPVERVGAAVDALLGDARRALDDLGIDQVAARVEEAFAAIDEFVDAGLSAAVVDRVRAALDDLAARLPTGQVAQVLAGLGRVAADAGALVAALASASADRLDQLRGFVDGLERLDFTPVTDTVVAELDEIRDRLRAMRPDALSAGERLAIRAGLAALRALDVRGQVIAEVTEAYDDVDRAARDALGGARGALDELAGAVARLDPAELLAELRRSLDETAAALRGASARALVAPLREDARRLTRELAEVRPGRLLDPLAEPYGRVSAAARRLDPATWLAPLAEVWRHIDGTLATLDVRPALAAVDARQRALLDAARRAVLEALDGLRLPEPLATFFAELRPTVEALTGDPEKLPETLLYQPPTVQLQALRRPLDAVWQRVLDLAAAAPEADLVAAVNAVRAGLGGVDRLNPAGVVDRLHQARDAFAAAEPGLFLGPVAALATLQERFQFTAVSAPLERQADAAAVLSRFVAVRAAAEAPALTGAHRGAVERFTARLATLDPAPTAVPYARLRGEMTRLVPPFLRAGGDGEPLDRAAVLAGLAALRPSTRTGHLDAALTRLLDAVAATRSGLDPVVDELFGAARTALDAISPATLAGALEGLYGAVRGKLDAIQPEALAARIRAELFQPLADALAAVDPARLGARLDASYDAAVRAVSVRLDETIDALAAAADEPLRRLAADVERLLRDVRTAVDTVDAALGEVLGRLRALDVASLVERLGTVLDNLRASFRAELRRVADAFDTMLAAIPDGRA